MIVARGQIRISSKYIIGVLEIGIVSERRYRRVFGVHLVIEHQIRTLVYEISQFHLRAEIGKVVGLVLNGGKYIVVYTGAYAVIESFPQHSGYAQIGVDFIGGYPVV